MKKDEQVGKLKKQVEELTNSWKRALADYQNLENRINSQRSDFAKSANKELILSLLPVLDGLESSGVHLKDKGLDLVIAEFKKIIRQQGVQEIPVSKGQKFDPQDMECVEAITGGNEGEIAEVILKGYQLNQNLIRPAKVKVFKKDNS